MILVTGTSGFIGGHLLDKLIIQYGKENLLALTSTPTDKCAFLLHHEYKFHPDLFLEAGYNHIRTIIHAGAFTPKNGSESNDIERSNSNIINTFTLINSTFPKLEKVIFLSTLDVYDMDIPIKESSPLNPISLYGHSKLYTEKMITVWAQQKTIDCLILRIGHVFGPGEEVYQKFMPIVINQILNGENVRILGDGEDIRTYIYISDVIESIIKAIDFKTEFEIINIVGEEQVNLKNLIDRIIKISGKKVVIENIESSHIPRNLIFDNSKLKNLLHQPKISLDEGLQAEIDYMLSL